MLRGKYICIEGLHGTGKSFLLEALRTHFKTTGDRWPEVLAFPSSGPTGGRIRDALWGRVPHRYPRSLLYLFAADCEERRDYIESALSRGTMVITDRHPLLPALIYQRHLHTSERIGQLIDLVQPVTPDLLLVLSASVGTILERLGRRPGQDDVVFEPSSAEQLEEMRRLYAELTVTAHLRGWARSCAMINADFEPELVLAQALDLIKQIAEAP